MESINIRQSNFNFEPYLMTPLDHTMGAIGNSEYTTFGLTFETNHPEKGLSTLQTGVSLLLEHLPFLTGEIAPAICEAKVNQMEVRPSSPCALKRNPIIQVRRHASYLSLDSFREGCKLGSESRVIRMLDDKYCSLLIHEDSIEPLLRFQANVLQDGIVLCIHFNHTAFDGTGVDRIISDLATCCKELDNHLRPISLETCAGKDAASRLAIFEAAHRAQGIPGTLSSSFGPNEHAGEPSEMVSENIYLSPSKLANLKDACNRELPKIQTNESDTKVTVLSTNDVLSAMLWLCMIRAFTSKKSPTSVALSSAGIMVDIRPRMQPPIAQSYTGTAVVQSSIQYERAELTQRLPSIVPTASNLPERYIDLLARIALVVRYGVNGIDDQHVSNVISRVCGARDWSENLTGPNEVHITSLAHFTVYEQDFGASLGMVKSFDLPTLKSLPLVSIKPRRRFDSQNGSAVDGGYGPFEVHISTEPETMLGLKEDHLMCWAAMGSLGLGKDRM